MVELCPRCSLRQKGEGDPNEYLKKYPESTKNEANPGSETGLFWKEIEGSQTNFVIDMMDVCWLANFEHVPPKVRICYHIKL